MEAFQFSIGSWKKMNETNVLFKSYERGTFKLSYTESIRKNCIKAREESIEDNAGYKKVPVFWVHTVTHVAIKILIDQKETTPK